MTTTINWNVTKLDVFAETLGNENTVCNIHLSVSATDGVNTIERTFVVGTALTENIEEYIPYEELTHEVVLSWAKDKLASNVQKFEDEVTESLQKISTPRPVLDLPWA
jgi:hypothetical protein